MTTYNYKLKKKDADEIRRITNDTGFFNVDEVRIAHELALEHLLYGEIKSGYSFITLNIDDKIIGYTCYGHIDGSASSYDLYWIVVDPKFGCKGYGSQLLHKTLQDIAAKGGKNVYAETASKAQYLPTQKFYSKNNFILEARLKDFYADNDDKLFYVIDCRNSGNM